MPIYFSALVPHPPILIPNIGKDNLKKLNKTAVAYEKIKERLKEKNIETLLIISPHGLIHKESFTANAQPNFSIGFSEFGDLGTKLEASGDVKLASQLQNYLEATDFDLQLIDEHNLDYGSAIPYYLLSSNNNLKILPLYPSNKNFNDHFIFGQLLAKELQNSSDRIAIIASGDLSHCLSHKAPAGYSPLGKKLDKKITDALINNQPQTIIQLETELTKKTAECGLRPLAILLGIMDKIHHQTTLLSYEAPFGVGYAVVEFDI